jgi:squalene-hopene/tetraprenyl-beta-curcumene cyclase
MGLCAFDDPNRSSVRRGIEYLIRTQNPDGSWTEDEATGTGFPRVFYLKYDIYRNAWPLLALATYRKLVARADVSPLKTVNGQTYSFTETLSTVVSPVRTK